MNFRLLIDECLSLEPVERAVADGHLESNCVRNMGWSGKKDRDSSTSPWTATTRLVWLGIEPVKMKRYDHVMLKQVDVV
jgi:hypothetical protein